MDRSQGNVTTVVVTKLRASRPRKNSPPPPRCAALSHQYSVASFATLRVLSCLHSPGLSVRVATLHDFAVTLKHEI
jgi:hypothetical protein